MSSRAAFRLLPVLALAAAVGGCGRDQRPPNLLLVVVDTLRADRLGIYGYDRRPTSPTLDAFAAEALVVEGLTASSSWTLPSMATLFTGREPAAHGVMRMAGEAARLAEATPTLARVLAAAGWTTGCVQTNFLLQRSWGTGLDRGFAWYDDSLIGPEAHRGSTAAAAADRALQWLGRQDRDRPWFLAVQFFDPHIAYEDHPEYGFEDPAYDGWVRGGLGGRELRDRLDRLSPADREQLGAFYDEEVRAVDDALGRLLAELRRRPDWDDTLVVVTADHGEELGERGWVGHTRTLHGELIDLPLIVRLPGGEGAGRRLRGRLPLSGLAATLLDLLGVPPDRLAGDSFAGFLRGGPAPAAAVAAEVDFVPALAENEDKRVRLRALIRGGHKLIVEPGGRRWLFDLAEDPGELQD
ncbi:MAG: hypothetical protein D6702_11900, partial [Planctomycetota bacterium]